MSRSKTRPSAAKLFRRWAYDREKFKNRVEEKVGGALLKWYQAALARSYGQKRWVQRYNREARKLLDSELVVVLLHPIQRFKDRRQAAAEVMQQLRASDPEYRRAAELIAQLECRFNKNTPAIPDAAADEFYRKVQAILDTHT